MKKVTLIVLFLCIAVSLSAQWRMTFHLQDGTTISYPVDSINGIGFTGIQYANRLYEFTMHPDSLWPNSPYTFPLGNQDSMWFSKSNDTTTLVVGQWADFGSPGAIGWYPTNLIDSITVAHRFLAPLDTNYNVINYPLLGSRFFKFPQWRGNRIYVNMPPHFFDINSEDSLLDYSEIGKGDTITAYMTINKLANRMLLVGGGGPSPFDYSYGPLSEIILDSASTTNIIPLGSGHASSALYYGDGSDTIIFYTHGQAGSRIDSVPGYYLMDRKAGKDSLILRYESDLGPWEMVNGFDISPDGKKLLVPVARSGKEPIVFEYDMTTGISDTFDISFDTTQFGPREALWLRYNHDGSKILYDNYPTHCFYGDGTYIGNFSEIGIIDRPTLTKQKLKTNPPGDYISINIMPEWSPDDSQIVYCASGLNDDGTTNGNFQVCILKTLQ